MRGEVITDEQLLIIEREVEKLLGNDDSGHDTEHIQRVATLADQIAKRTEAVSRGLVRAIALLHDVDDYKLVGKEAADSMANTSRIMAAASIGEVTQEEIRDAIMNMGYSKSLKGIRPKTPEGKVASDADLCDAIGAIGIVRCLQYAVSSRGSGVVFDPGVWPNTQITAEEYNAKGSTHDTDSFINHFFERLLYARDLMQTKAGYEEACVRHDEMVNFLRAFFREHNQPEWSEFLENYLRELDEKAKQNALERI